MDISRKHDYSAVESKIRYRLKKDIVIKAGTIFECIDGRSSSYGVGNYSTSFDLGPDSTGEVIYSGIEDDQKAWEWFEEVKD